MGNDYFEFKQFRITQPQNVFRVGTDGVLLGAWAGSESIGVKRILDVGTGTGLLALMMAQRFPEASVTAIEPESESFRAAWQNVSDSKWKPRIEVLNLSFNDYVDTYPGKFDIIITNPPFFKSSLRNPDPVKAGFRHVDTLSFEMITSLSKKLLDDNGRLCIVLPWAEGNVFIANAVFDGFFCSRMAKVRPLLNSRFNRLLLEFTGVKCTPVVNILTLGHPSHGGYSVDYRDLTKEFYIYF
ncbi:MAG: methyltransferase [Bacteroidales bacterium]|nr:methyltransferase [Bacteroidales bacterium]